MSSKIQNKLSKKEQQDLLLLLQARFEKNQQRHKGAQWNDVQKRLLLNDAHLWSLQQMEATGGEPDVVLQDKTTGAFFFFDCAAETPSGRRSTCYDREGLESRKEFKPQNNALDMAAQMGITLLNEEQYRYLQTLGAFDTKTSSWIATPAPIRKLGGALFADRRYNQVFVYHNGAQSYYGARGFRGCLLV